MLNCNQTTSVQFSPLLLFAYNLIGAERSLPSCCLRSNTLFYEIRLMHPLWSLVGKLVYWQLLILEEMLNIRSVEIFADILLYS